MSHFFAMLSRMKYIRRWGLMRNTQEENIQEHTLQTAMIAYHLCVLRNVRFGGTVDPQRAAVLAMYHDVTEIFTGDMPTPVKYFTPLMRETYGRAERLAGERLVASLPEDLQSAYAPLILAGEDDPVWPFVKAADTLSAYLKCLQEKHAGNTEFDKAYGTIGKKLRDLHMPEVDVFMEEYAPAFLLSLDEMDF
ncbi:5'-deoxynucleotidase [Anaeroglobus geminatus]|jgi:5'-deoxynucleotidase|uniref:HD domain protein n=1 Tax=Anaeroglobus geminatus F0357 TaxID=861450 RepID=G9YKB7_9FIRM|nr:5'-deoxynucleotidase [Anaeroglobus geminatus]EHM37588.1 HD domain protein [Anaeroglobus geminatus F0357]